MVFVWQAKTYIRQYARAISIFWNQVFLFSNEHLPIHVHIKNADGSARFEVNPLKLLENKGIKSKDIHLAESIIEENTEVIINRWNEYFGNE